MCDVLPPKLIGQAHVVEPHPPRRVRSFRPHPQACRPHPHAQTPPPYAEGLDESRGASETSSKRGLLNDTQCGVLPGSPRGPGEPCQPAGVRTLHPDTGEQGVGMGQPLNVTSLGTSVKPSKCRRQKALFAWLSTRTRGASCPHRGARPEAGLAHNPALHPKPGAPRWRDWHGPPSNVSPWVRMQKVLSADGKRAVLPGSPRGPGEPWAPTGVPGQKPATPTFRLSTRNRPTQGGGGLAGLARAGL